MVVPGVKVAYERHVAEGARDVVLLAGGGGGGGKEREREREMVGGSGVRVGRVRWGRRGERVGWVG